MNALSLLLCKHVDRELFGQEMCWHLKVKAQELKWEVELGPGAVSR